MKTKLLLSVFFALGVGSIAYATEPTSPETIQVCKETLIEDKIECWEDFRSDVRKSRYLRSWKRYRSITSAYKEYRVCKITAYSAYKECLVTPTDPTDPTDTDAPILSFNPNSVTVESNNSIESTLTVTDNVGVTSEPTVLCTNGGIFLGSTFSAPVVTDETISICTATANDAGGNQGTATLTVTITTPPPTSTELEVTSLQIVSSEDGRFILRPTVRNGTSSGFLKLSVSAYPVNPDFRMLEKDVFVGSINSGFEFSTQDSFLVSSIADGIPTLADFTFAFDEQDNVDGSDVNQDGIRDDIEIMIEDYLTDNSEARAHLRGLAKESQNLLQSTTAADANDALDNAQLYVLCAEGVLGENNKGAIDVLLLQVMDTEERFIKKFTAVGLAETTRPPASLPNDQDLEAFCSTSLTINQ